jgi:hypothetical protein
MENDSRLKDLHRLELIEDLTRRKDAEDDSVLVHQLIKQYSISISIGN